LAATASQCSTKRGTSPRVGACQAVARCGLLAPWLGTTETTLTGLFLA
jgi:hypothetical protein